LWVYADGVPEATPLHFLSSPTCPIALPSDLPAKYRQNRAVAVGDWGSGMQIAVGTPTASGHGSVSVFSVASGGIGCAFRIDGSEARFGQALAVGDFNGDKTLDLLVGAPPGNAYVYFGPLGGPSRAALAGPSGSVELGAAVAAANVDGAGGDEALVGDPAATVDGVEQAGRVVIFSVASATATPTVKAVLTDRYPGAGAGYGLSVGGLQFCKGACAASDLRRLALVGAASKTLTAFQLA